MKFLIILLLTVLLLTVQARPSNSHKMVILRSKFCNLETCEKCGMEARRKGGRSKTARMCRTIQFICTSVSPTSGRVTFCNKPLY